MLNINGLCIGDWLSYINRNSGTVTQVLSTTAETSAVGATAGNAVDMGYTVGYFLQNPWKLIQMLANTVADKTEFYLKLSADFQIL